MKREYRLTRQKDIRLLRAIHRPQNKSHARLCAMALASALSCMVMVSTTFSTSALAAAKEKIDTFDTSSLSEFVQAGAQGLQSGADTLIQDAKQLSALSEEAAPVVNDDAIVVQDGQVIIKGNTTEGEIRTTMQSQEGKAATEVLFENQITITTDTSPYTGAFSNATSLQQVKAEPGAKVSFAAASGASTLRLGYFFKGCTSLESIDGLSAWDVSNVTGTNCMDSMFYGCSKLASLDALSAWDVSNVTGRSCMMVMFSGCSSLESLNGLSAWDVSNVTGESCMADMFSGCSRLTSLDGLSAWDVSNVTGVSCMANMFSGCTNLTSLDGLSAWNVSNVADDSCMKSMFANCSLLQSLDGLSAWDVSNVEGSSCMREMFSGCSRLTSLNALSAWDVSKVKDDHCMRSMFLGCSKLTSLDGLSAWNVSNVTGQECMASMFSGCSELISLDALANWNITGALSSRFGVSSMFYNCSNIASITLGGKEGFKLSGDMRLPSANWWPVDNTSATTGIDTAALVTKSQEDDPPLKRWQRCTSGSSKPTIDVSTLQVEWPETNLAYTGLSQTIKPTSVTADGTLLTPGTDFYVSYTKGGTTTDAMKDAGIYTATVNLRGAYKGNPATKEIAIAKLNLARTDNRPQVYTVPSECPYTGSPITPKTMVRVNVGSADRPLYAYLIEKTTGRPDGDYTVTYANNVEPGEATAKVKYATPAGLTDPNLEGEASAPFQIVDTRPRDPYVVLSEDGTEKKLTFTYEVNPPSGTEGTNWWKIADSYTAAPAWAATLATKIVIDESFKGYTPQSSAYWFSNLSATESIEGIQNITSTSLAKADAMFSGCAALSALDLSEFTPAATCSQTSMFANTSALKNLTLAKNFALKSGTGLAGLNNSATSHTSFWITDITAEVTYATDEAASVAAINTVLASLPSSASSQTFTLATRTYTFAGNGGVFGTGDSAPSTFSYYGNQGDRLGETPSPTYTGYKQNGWWSAPVDGTEVTIPATFGTDQQTTVYAHWTRDDDYAEVTFNTNGATQTIAPVMVKKGDTLSAPTTTPTRDNATFDMWCADTALKSAFDFATPITGDTTLYARWKAQDPTTYSVVNFNTQGGSFVDSQVVQNNTAAVRPTQDPTKEHYAFDNWYADADATNLWDFNSTIAADTTIYAGWTLASYTITFNANGLTFQDGSTEKSEAFDLGADLTAPELSLPEDVEFVGWFTEPTGGEPMPQKCAGTATYFAQYNILPPGPTPGPEPTPDAGGDLMPITGDTLFSASSWMFLAVLAGGIALTAAHILRRKRSL